MKIIFLDVDGVLNHSETPEWATATPYNDVLDQGCILQLDRIITFTGAKLVISSSWRLNPIKCKKLNNELQGEIIGVTSEIYGGDDRKKEILDWLFTIWPRSYGWNGEMITHIAVIDDDWDADLGDGSFFKTDFEAGGLTKEIADKIIIHLGGIV